MIRGLHCGKLPALNARIASSVSCFFRASGELFRIVADRGYIDPSVTQWVRSVDHGI
jgi:hypothetical protein